MSCNQHDYIAPLVKRLEELFNVSQGVDMRVEKRYINGMLDFKVNYHPYRQPTITLTPEITLAEVGQVLPTVNFAGSIKAGSEAIVSRAISPQAIASDELDESFSFSVNNVSSNSAGKAAEHIITVTDARGSYSKEAYVEFSFNYLWGYSDKDSLTAADTTAFDRSLGAFVKKKNYDINLPGLYIYWLCPEGSHTIESATINGFDLPITTLSNINITNQYGISSSYVVQRTVNKFNVGTLQNVELDIIGAVVSEPSPSPGAPSISSVTLSSSSVEQFSDLSISWNKANTTFVSIALFKGGAKVRDLITSTSATSYTWRVPLSERAGDDYYIRIYDDTVFQDSQTFSISPIEDAYTISEYEAL